MLGKSSGLKIKKVTGMTDGFGGSDHQSFYPRTSRCCSPSPASIATTTGRATTRTGSTYAGMARIADYLELLVLDVGPTPEAPELLKVGRGSPRTAGHKGRRGPARGGPERRRSRSGSGLSRHDPRLRRRGQGREALRRPRGQPRREGRPQGRRRRHRFGGKPIATIYDYTDALAGSKPGDKVDVVVKRDGKDVTLKVILGSRPRGN